MPYHPSYNAPSAFIACGIYDRGEKIGVLAFQMPIDKINDIMKVLEIPEKPISLVMILRSGINPGF